MEKSAVIVALFMAVIGVGLGIIIGYFAIKREPDGKLLHNVCEVSDYSKESGGFVGMCIDDCRIDACQGESCELKEPRSYVTYHLQGKTVNIDGKIDEEAWNEVPWTEDFVDLLGVDYPTPHFTTKVKIRWDDTTLYVAARLQEENVWANKTEHDSKVYLDNAFEIYVDTDGTTHNYKEFQINALETTWDLRLSKAYIDGGEALSNWESGAVHKVFTDGVVNDVSVTSTFWSVEIAIPFAKLRENSVQPNGGSPADKDIWRVVLARPEWRFDLANGKYVKDESAGASWWSWQPHGAVSLHLPDKWGALQFSRGAVKSQMFMPNDQWKISQALFASFHAMMKYKAEYGLYTTDKKLLDLPQYLMSGVCFGTPVVVLRNNTFVVSVSSKGNSLTGHIRADRYTWFYDLEAGLLVP